MYNGFCRHTYIRFYNTSTYTKEVAQLTMPRITNPDNTPTLRRSRAAASITPIAEEFIDNFNSNVASLASLRAQRLRESADLPSTSEEAFDETLRRLASQNDFTGEPTRNPFSNSTFTCFSCNTAQATTAGAGFVSSAESLACRNCLEAYYHRCNDCCCWTRATDLRAVSSGAGSLGIVNVCDDCVRRRVIRSYDYDVVAHHGMRGIAKCGEPRYGVEVEVEADGDKYDAATRVEQAVGDFSIIKRDGSLGESGFEIVSCPAIFDFHLTAWDKFFTGGATEGLRSARTRTCGMHVHISRDVLTTIQIGKMLSFLHNPANKSFVETVAGRPSNHYCDFTADKKVTDALDSSFDHDDRYTALNLTNRSTVEFRLFASTVDHWELREALEFADALVKFCTARTRHVRDVTLDNFYAYVYRQRRTYHALNLAMGRYQHEVSLATEVEPAQGVSTPATPLGAALPVHYGVGDMVNGRLVNRALVPLLPEPTYNWTF